MKEQPSTTLCPFHCASVRVRRISSPMFDAENQAQRICAAARPEQRYSTSTAASF
jgi:hypothetical protein